MTTRTIVVPLDGSQFAEAAIPAAVKMADTLSASLTFVTAYDDEVLVAGYPLDAASIRAGCAAYLEDVSARVQTHFDVELHTSVITGSVTRTLIEYIQRTQPVMVAMATHGRGPMARFWLGSVADRVLRYVKVPVLLIRPHDSDSPVDLSRPVAFRKVLVPVDGSARAEEGITWATKIVPNDGMNLSILRSVSIPTIASPYLPHTIHDTEEALDAERAEAERYLAGLEAKYQGREFTVESSVVTGRSAAASILQSIEQEGIDLTVITTHGRTGLARVLFGSVADKVIRGASGPVLVVRTVHAAGDMDEALTHDPGNKAVTV